MWLLGRLPSHIISGVRRNLKSRPASLKICQLGFLTAFLRRRSVSQWLSV